MHDSEPNFMPDVHEAALDLDGVRHLLGDIEACATLQSITIKRGPLQHADPAAATLQSAANELFSGTARAIQLRYRHRGTDWTDTVLRTEPGYRLIRVAVTMT